MDMSNPFQGVVPRKMSTTELARAIMQDICAELDAVFLYQAHIDATDDERAKKILAHVRDEEKQHIAEFLSLLEVLDPDMSENLQIGSAEAEDMLREISGADKAKAESTNEREQAAKSSLTVGSMIEI